MPFCARCLGASIGHVSSLLIYIFFSLPAIYFSFIGLAVMYADWALQNKAVYHSNIMRLITGITGGLAMGVIIWSIVDFIIKFISHSI